MRFRTLLNSTGGMRRGVVQEISHVVMKSFRSIKNTSIPQTLEHQLAALTNVVEKDDKNEEVTAWERDKMGGTKRLRGGPNTSIDMTSDKRVAPNDAAKNARKRDRYVGGELAEQRRNKHQRIF